VPEKAHPQKLFKNSFEAHYQQKDTII